MLSAGLQDSVEVTEAEAFTTGHMIPSPWEHFSFQNFVLQVSWNIQFFKKDKTT